MSQRSKPTISRKRRNPGPSLLAKRSKSLTTTIEKVIDEPKFDNRVSVIKYAPKRPIEVVDISDDETLDSVEIPLNNDQIDERFANWKLIVERNPTESEKFKRIEKFATFEVNHNITNSSNLMEYQKQIDDSYEAAIKHFIEGYPGDFMFSAKIEHEKLNKCIYLRPEKIKDFDKTRFLNKVFMVSQSNEEFLMNGLLKVQVVITKKVVGSGRTTKAPQTYDEQKKRKTSIIVVKNNDQSCGYRALFLGMRYHELNIRENGRSTEWKALIQSPPQQKYGALQLCAEIQNFILLNRQELQEKFNNINIDFDTPMDIEILQIIQKFFGDRYQMVAINHRSGDQLFVGPDSDRKIYLLFTPDGQSGHWDLIKEITSYLNCVHYCIKCNKGYNTPRNHSCVGGCKLCRHHTTCFPDETTQHCGECNKKFANTVCFNRHIENKVCKYIKICPLCEAQYTKESREHTCGEFKCKNCAEYYTEQPHYCYLKKLDTEKLCAEDATTKIIVSFDIESMLIQSSDKTFDHKPNLLCAMTVCDSCYDPITKLKSEDYCNICRDGNKIFRGDDCVALFNEYVFNHLAKIAERNKGQILVVAHNLSGYDGHWVFRDVLARGMRNIEPVMKGTKLMKIDVGNVRFIDSLLFFQQALASLPKAFELDDAEKGHFPHFMNTPEFQDLKCLIGDIPLDKYGIKTMKKGGASKLQQWYEANRDKSFDMQRDIVEYCKNDVLILLQSIMSFRQLFKDQTGLDPLSRAFTLASVGLEYFRANILEAKTIGVTPIEGYVSKRKNSHLANAWLDYYESIIFKKKIIREYRIGPYFADGFINEQYTHPVTGRTYDVIAFEFWGCYYHGHEHCGKGDETKAAATQKKIEYYEKKNIFLIHEYECEFWRTTKSKEPVFNESRTTFIFKRMAFLKKVSNNNLHCNPRNALHGGRTNNLKFAYKAASDENILYYDFTSLYPYVLANRQFPIGHPEVITCEFDDISQYFGFVSCKVIPPKQLYLPVLPMSIDGKLVFALCRTCASKQNQETCGCSDEDRSFTGTFTTCELAKALECGYELMEVYEVLNYPTQSNEIFRRYIRTWLKIKAESSGYPKDKVTDEQRHQWIEEFEGREGIQLDRNNIKYNGGLRFIAKLMLNSLWGKLAQRPNQPQTKVINDYTEMWNLINNPQIEILGEITINDMLIYNYKYFEDQIARPGNTAVALAAFVTSYARLKLYEEMEKIEQSSPGSVLYMDTDSIIFVHKEGNYKPRVANFLGEMTDEITEEFGLGARMTEFYTCGPKTYSYKVVKADGSVVTKLKAKGVTQTVEANEVLSYDLIKTQALSKKDAKPNIPSFVPQIQFRANEHHEVTTLLMEKRFQVTSDKRRVIGNNTLPYGYVD